MKEPSGATRTNKAGNPRKPRKPRKQGKGIATVTGGGAAVEETRETRVSIESRGSNINQKHQKKNMKWESWVPFRPGVMHALGGLTCPPTTAARRTGGECSKERDREIERQREQLLEKDKEIEQLQFEHKKELQGIIKKNRRIENLESQITTLEAQESHGKKQQENAQLTKIAELTAMENKLEELKSKLNSSENNKKRRNQNVNELYRKLKELTEKSESNKTSLEELKSKLNSSESNKKQRNQNVKKLERNKTSLKNDLEKAKRDLQNLQELMEKKISEEKRNNEKTLSSSTLDVFELNGFVKDMIKFRKDGGTFLDDYESLRDVTGDGVGNVRTILEFVKNKTEKIKNNKNNEIGNTIRNIERNIIKNGVSSSTNKKLIRNILIESRDPKKPAFKVLGMFLRELFGRPEIIVVANLKNNDHIPMDSKSITGELRPSEDLHRIGGTSRSSSRQAYFDHIKYGGRESIVEQVMGTIKESIKRIIETTEHIVVFAYGPSGSGKTHILSKTNEEKIIRDVGLEITREKIMNYYGYLDFKLSDYHVKTSEDEIVRPTMNNGESSRSQKITEYTCTYGNEKKVFVHMVDMAGSESPTTIFKQYTGGNTLDNLSSSLVKLTALSKGTIFGVNFFAENSTLRKILYGVGVGPNSADEADVKKAKQVVNAAIEMYIKPSSEGGHDSGFIKREIKEFLQTQTSQNNIIDKLFNEKTDYLDEPLKPNPNVSRTSSKIEKSKLVISVAHAIFMYAIRLAGEGIYILSTANSLKQIFKSKERPNIKNKIPNNKGSHLKGGLFAVAMEELDQPLELQSFTGFTENNPFIKRMIELRTTHQAKFIMVGTYDPLAPKGLKLDQNVEAIKFMESLTQDTTS